MGDPGAGAADGAVHPKCAERHAAQTPFRARAGVVNGKTVTVIPLVTLTILHIKRNLPRPMARQCRHLLDPDTGVRSGMDGGEVDYQVETPTFSPACVFERGKTKSNINKSNRPCVSIAVVKSVLVKIDMTIEIDAANTSS